MPEASSYSAQNSTDLSAAISPGSSYLISFCKNLAHPLLAFLLSRFLPLLHAVWLIVFFPQRIWFPFFFSSWLGLCLAIYFFSPKYSMVNKGGEVRKLEKVVLGGFSSLGGSTQALENSTAPTYSALQHTVIPAACLVFTLGQRKYLFHCTGISSLLLFSSCLVVIYLHLLYLFIFKLNDTIMDCMRKNLDDTLRKFFLSNSLQPPFPGANLRL